MGFRMFLTYTDLELREELIGLEGSRYRRNGSNFLSPVALKVYPVQRAFNHDSIVHHCSPTIPNHAFLLINSTCPTSERPNMKDQH